MIKDNNTTKNLYSLLMKKEINFDEYYFRMQAEKLGVGTFKDVCDKDIEFVARYRKFN